MTDPTELAPSVDQTESITAWAEDYPETESFATPRRITLLAVLVSLALVAAAVFTAVVVHSSKTNPSAPSQPSLDGTFEVTFHNDQTKLNNTAYPKPVTTDQWAFHTKCDQTCLAYGAVTLQFVNDVWTGSYVHLRAEPLCLNGKTVGPGGNKEKVLIQLRPDGTGQISTQTLTNECGFGGMVMTTPLTYKRAGDAGEIEEKPLPPVLETWPGDPVGLYVLSYKLSEETRNGNPVTDGPGDFSETWAFQTVCSGKGCAMTGAKVMADDVHQNAGASAVLLQVNGEWQRTPTVRPAEKCGDVVPMAWTVRPDFRAGVVTAEAVASDCGDTGTVWKFPFDIVKVGDVPAGVVLGDPAAVLG